MNEKIKADDETAPQKLDVPNKSAPAAPPEVDATRAGLPENRPGQRFGFVAIIGAPNAGKSTLVNELVGAKVTIVSRKVQTTRTPIRGIAIVDDAQLVFVDTPGIFQPRRRLDRAMVEAAWSGAGEADVVVLLIDAPRGLESDVQRLLDRVKHIPVPVILALNKVDLIHKEKLLSLTAELNTKMKFAATFMISALKGSGVEDLARFLAKTVPLGVWHYPENDVTDAPARLIASEITREQIYDRLHEELPYAITVETTAWKDMGKKKGVRIEQTIFVERDSQRSIVLGKDGDTIKTISQTARLAMADIFGRPVHLFLFVKVREGWENDPERYIAMGLAFPKE